MKIFLQGSNGRRELPPDLVEAPEVGDGATNNVSREIGERTSGSPSTTEHKYPSQWKATCSLPDKASA
jgi:hypothetical protein